MLSCTVLFQNIQSDPGNINLTFLAHALHTTGCHAYPRSIATPIWGGTAAISYLLDNLPQYPMNRWSLDILMKMLVPGQSSKNNAFYFAGFLWANHREIWCQPPSTICAEMLSLAWWPNCFVKPMRRCTLAARQVIPQLFTNAWNKQTTAHPRQTPMDILQLLVLH